ncbi:MAG: KaiC 1, partial [Deltaproteobacteria bacterium]
LYILKSRGMEHSNQIRELYLTDNGVQLRDVYVGSSGVLTGAARIAQVAREKAEKLQRSQDLAQKQREIERNKAVIEAQIAALRTGLDAEKEDLERAIARENLYQKVLDEETLAMAQTRRADDLVSMKKGGAKPGKRGRK